jgi:glycerophosphoryl diester phosphodiesterase
MFEQTSAREAFALSAALTQGVRWKVLSAVVLVSILALALGAAASALGGVCAAVVFGLIGQSVPSLAISFGMLLLLRTIIGAALTVFGSCVDAGVFTWFYRRRQGLLGGAPALALPDERRLVPTGWVPPAVVAGLLACAATGTWLALDAIPDGAKVSIHAHRGVTTQAPENTLGAVREAIAAGADYLETDVQLSKDDVLVVAHDSDFSRLAGVAKKVWDLTYEDIRAIPLGRGFSPDSAREFMPTFDALLAETKGRIKVNIELKYYGEHQPGLARKVIEAVRARGMLDQVVVQCLEYEPLLEVRQLAPNVPVGYLLSFNARTPSRLDVDFLSVEQKRLNRSFILGAHHRGQQVYAWTVNTAEDIQRLCDLGVDGVITDQAALARKSVDAFNSRSKAERSARRLRAWLVD